MYIYLQKVEFSACFPQGFTLLFLESSEKCLSCSLPSPRTSLNPCPPSLTSFFGPTPLERWGVPVTISLCRHEKVQCPFQGWTPRHPRLPPGLPTALRSRTLGHAPPVLECKGGSALLIPCVTFPHTRLIKPCLPEEPHVGPPS